MKKSTVVIALLAVLAIVFGILFITGNNEKNDLQAKVDELNTVVKSAADQGKIDLDSAVAAAKQEAEEATNKAVEDALAAAKVDADAATTKAVEDAVANAKAEADKALADVKAEGEKALADAKEAGEKALAEAQEAGEKALAEAQEALANAKAEGEKALADAKAAGEKAVEDAKAEGEKALKAVQDELETWKTKAGDLEKQIADAAAAATEKVEEVKEAVTDKTEEVKDAATEKVEEVKEAAEEVKETATEAVEEATETVEEKVEEAAEAVEEKVEEAVETAEEAVGEIAVMDHAAYVAAELDTEVVIETTVQATQAWWEKDGVGKITVYGQSEDGAYFIYEMNCSKEDAEKLVPGAKIKVKGFKSAWSGEVEITDATFEFVEGEGFKAEPEDVTALLGTEELINKQNALVAFKGLTVAAKKDAEGNDAAFLYKWNGAGQQGDDLYFDVTVNDATYTFVVESYLCGQDTEVYKAVEGLKVGDVIDAEGFLYWYEGVQPHIIKVAAAQ
ncbi:hypothetical protein JNO48_13105 [Clostridiales bacterium]|nr:hypothetical protein JNO48_13105 [Clostridiales bacterium]